MIAEYSSKPPTQNPTTSFTITDQLGSPRVLVNSLGQVVSRRDFLPFGEEIVPDAANLRTDASLKYNGDTVRQKFTGYQKDEESGLDFAEARMYENRHGRFTAVDPLLASGKSANPQTFNRYVYVLNNSPNSTDPTGLQAGDYAGPVYANATETGFSKSSGTGRHKYEKFRVDDAEDGYRYYITPIGWTQLGKTRDLIENDISDLQSVEVGLKRWVNQFFDVPLDVSPLHSNPNVYPSISDLTGFRPFSDAEIETKTWRDWGIATATQIGVDALAAKGIGKLAEAAEISSISRGRPNPFSSIENFKPGTFSISDWTGYPESYIRPEGPFRLLQGEEYKIARRIADKTNRGLHIQNPGLKGLQIHEIHPVKFGGSPTDSANKVVLTPAQHHRFNVFWKTLQKSIE